MLKRKQKNQARESSMRSPRITGDREYSNNRTISSHRYNAERGGRSNVRGRTGSKGSSLRSLFSSKERLYPRLAFAAGMLIVLVAVMYSLTLDASVRVEFYNDQTPLFSSKEEYEAALSSIVGGGVSSTTKLTIDTKRIESKIMDKFPEVGAASISLPIVGRTPKVILAFREPALMMFTSSSSGVVVDSDGVAIGYTGDTPESIKKDLLIVTDETDAGIDIGSQIITQEAVRFILEVNLQLEAKGLRISKLSLPIRLNELDVYIDGLGYYVKTDASGDARQQIGSYVALKNALEGRGVQPAEYIDVRAEEKIFYK